MSFLDLIVKFEKFSLVKFFPIKARISNHSPSHTETSQLIFTTNKFTGFIIKDQCKKYQISGFSIKNINCKKKLLQMRNLKNIYISELTFV